MERLFSQLPKAFQKILNMDRLSLFEVLGYFGSEAHTFILLVGSVYAAILGSTVLSRESSERTAEFLLSRPVTRSRVIGSKALACLVCLFCFEMVVWVISYVSIIWVTKDDFSRVTFVKMAVLTFGTHLTFANLGFLGSVVSKKDLGSTGTAIGLVMGTYALQVISEVTRKAEFLRFVSPMKWGNAADVIAGTIQAPYVVLMLVANFAAIAGSFTAFRRKDILA